MTEYRIYKGHRDFVLQGPDGRPVARFATRHDAEVALRFARNAQKTNSEINQWVTSYCAQQQH